MKKYVSKTTRRSKAVKGPKSTSARTMARSKRAVRSRGLAAHMYRVLSSWFGSRSGRSIKKFNSGRSDKKR